MSKEVTGLCVGWKKVGYNDVTILNPIAFEFNVQELSSYVRKPDDYGGIIFTSPRSVEALSKVVLNEVWKSKTAFCVGQATTAKAKQLLDNKFANFLGGKETGNSEKLAKFILENDTCLKQKKLLFPSGNLTDSFLKDKLKTENIIVDQVTVYITKANPQIEKMLLQLDFSSEKCVFVFFSPSGIKAVSAHFKSFRQKMSENEVKSVFIAIGPTTSKAFNEEMGFPVDSVCECPNPDSLTKVLEDLS